MQCARLLSTQCWWHGWVLSHSKAQCGCDLCPTLLPRPLPLPPWLLGLCPDWGAAILPEHSLQKLALCHAVIFLINEFRGKLNNLNTWFYQKRNERPKNAILNTGKGKFICGDEELFTPGQFSSPFLSSWLWKKLELVTPAAEDEGVSIWSSKLMWFCFVFGCLSQEERLFIFLLGP